MTTKKQRAIGGGGDCQLLSYAVSSLQRPRTTANEILISVDPSVATPDEFTISGISIPPARAVLRLARALFMRGWINDLVFAVSGQKSLGTQLVRPDDW